MARTDYYDTDAKLLETFGSGTPVDRRMISRDDYTKIKDDYAAKALRAAEIFEEQNRPKPGHPPPVYDFGRPNVLFQGGVEPLLNKSSKVLSIQGNGPAVIADLVRSAQSARKEQGAYIVFQFSTAKVMFVAATPVRSSDVEITFSLAPFKDLRLVPADHTMQVIGTVHTHYATVPAAQRDSGGTTTYSIHPGVSDKDKNSAKVDKIVVYAVDAHNVHKALPGGQAQNNLARSLDIITDALDTFGRS